MVKTFKKNREDSFIPQEWICVDDSISQWCGIGGSWINIGISMYIVIGSNPENGCKI